MPIVKSIPFRVKLVLIQALADELSSARRKPEQQFVALSFVKRIYDADKI